MRHLLPFALLVPLSFGCSDDEPDSNAESGGSGGNEVAGTGSSSSSGGGGNSGGSSSGGGDGSGGSTASGGNTSDPALPLSERLKVSSVSVSEGVQDGVMNWRIWGRGDLHVAPVYTAPLSDCRTLVCYTSGAADASKAHVAVLKADDTLDQVIDVGDGFECRGLAAEEDGHFAVLLWDKTDRIYVQRFASDGTPTWNTRTELTNADNKPDDFGIGESRLEFGDGRYGAYYHVHSDSGHEGDTLKYVNAETGVESTEWGWGCSHSMSELLRYNAGLNEFLPACVTDCFPGTSGDFAANSIGGIYLNHNDSKVLDVDAGCNGSVAGELGGAAPASDGWKLVFNAHQAPAELGNDSYSDAKNQDIGFSAIGADLSASEVVWLTNTPDIDEADSSIAELTGGAETQFVIGWSTPAGEYRLGLYDAQGAVVLAPEDVSSISQWGRRDDPFRTHENGDVVWAWFENPGDTTLHFSRISSGAACK